MDTIQKWPNGRDAYDKERKGVGRDKEQKPNMYIYYTTRYIKYVSLFIISQGVRPDRTF